MLEFQRTIFRENEIPIIIVPRKNKIIALRSTE